MKKRNFVLSVLLIISALLFAVPIDKEQLKTQIVSKEIASYREICKCYRWK